MALHSSTDYCASSSKTAAPSSNTNNIYFWEGILSTTPLSGVTRAHNHRNWQVSITTAL